MATSPEEQIDTCRICSGPAEPGEPLFHPCRCSGTIRYIHQDCLTTWLQHSKKGSCDVCKTEYAFQKVYDPDMPERLPALLFIRRLAVQVLHWKLFALRTVVIATIWLAFLPYTTVWVWRLYFWAGEHIAWKTYGEERPSLSPPSPLNVPANLTASESSPSSDNRLFLTTLLSKLPKSEVFHDVWGDILTGQIIAALIIVLFLAVFLLREWIVQNARPGIFGEPVVPDGAEEARPAAAGQDPHQPDQPDVNQGELQPENVVAFPAAQGQGQGEELAFRFLNRRLERGRHLGQRRVEQADGAPVPVRDDLGRVAHHHAGRRAKVQLMAPHPQFAEQGVPRRRRVQLKRLRGTTGITDDVDVNLLDDHPSEPEQDHYAPGSNPELERIRMRTEWERYFARPENTTIEMNSDFATSSRYSFASTASSSDVDESTTTSSGKELPATYSAFVLACSIPLPPSPEARSLDLPYEASSIPPIFPSDPAMIPLPPSPSSSHDDQRSTWEVKTPRWVQKLAEKPQDEGDQKQSMFSPPPLNPSALHQDDESDIFAREARVSTSSWDSWGQTGSPSASSSYHPIPDSLPSSIHVDSLVPGPSTHHVASIPRRPHLPPTTPNEELPPPSPRPSHARPSPLPTAHGAHTQLGHASPHPASSKLRDATTPSGIDFGKATYRAPEDLDLATSYFPTSTQDAPEGGEETDIDDQDDDWGMERGPLAQEDDIDVQEQLPVPGHHGIRERRQGAIANEERRLRQQIDNEAARQNWDANAPNAPNNDEAEMVEGGEDDMDGLLEAVGMRGPLLAIVQNVALIILILDMTIGGAVWIPFTIGRSLALNLMKPRRLLFVLHLPIRIVRLATDPIVDVFLWFLRPASTHLFGVLSEVWKLRASHTPDSAVRLDSIYDHVSNRLKQILASAGSKNFPLAYSTSHIDQLLMRLSDHFESYIPVQSKTALLAGRAWAREIYSAYGRVMASRWKALATGAGPSEQLFSVFLGYVALLGFGGSFLASGILYSGASTFVRSAITQQLIVVKVAVFILIELVVFPFGCGIILDISTLPLFKDATIWTRLEYCASVPLTAVFFHWMLGTMFMYQFAMLLAACRGLMRKGAMWFIKDPADPSFHPIRDILDRPALSQLRKLGVSALMYSFVILGGVGAAIYYLRYFWTPFHMLLPLRWDAKNPISEIPIDLLFLHIVAPAIIESVNVRDTLVRATTIWWEHAAHELRLTSYMFGQRVAEEEQQSVFSWRRLPLIRNRPWAAVHAANQPAPVRDGSFVRAPAGDSIAFPENERQMLVTTDENGNPLDDEGRRLIEVQDAAALAAHRTVADDYTVLYLPPNFKYRIMAFIMYLWLTSVGIATVAVDTPILFGRLLLDRLVGHATHDGYSFIIGASSFWALITFGRFVVRQYQGVQDLRQTWRATWQLGNARPDTTALGVDPLYTEIGHGVVWIGKLAVLTIALGFIIPLLLALVVELYIILPIRIGLFPMEQRAPTIYIWEDWALGLVLFNIALRMARLQNPPAIVAAWDAMVDNGVTFLDFHHAMVHFVWPVISGLLLMIAAPGIIPFSLTKVLHVEVPDNLSIRTIYPAIFIGACTVTMTSTTVNYLEKWAQTVRDSEFLIDKRLQNLEPDGTRSIPDIPARSSSIRQNHG
ncbi:uncharacterized protein EI90DRAFT_2975197 [Cantharellus anzutake]|uniref:uncharacterized protein n=1 Tax=Cantharellus anzutake TaxID=1750568 RepID=UPI0019046802|nr:uncharacterized protein EI90DRAFT_2975197 [Cantharellus anzutake]KAF8327196.1 hypothetical protein EI90DRAFT_2975197 [Cantharellus anzutake]